MSSLLAPSSVSPDPAPFLRIHGKINQIPHTEEALKNSEWMRISMSFGLVTDCCVANYSKAHCLNNKHLSFLIVSVVCEFGRKLDGQLSCGLSQEVESEGNQDCSPLKSFFQLEDVCKMACSHGWQTGAACWLEVSVPLHRFSSVTQHADQPPLKWWSKRISQALQLFL